MNDVVRASHISSHAAIVWGSAALTCSCIRNICILAGSSDGSWRKQYDMTSTRRPLAGSVPASVGYTG